MLVTGAHGGLGAACNREGVICAFSFTAGAVMGRPRSRRRCRSGWLWGFYQVAGLTIRGVAPVDAVVPIAIDCDGRILGLANPEVNRSS